MAKSLNVGETVFVPLAALKLSVDQPSAFYESRIEAVDRSVPQVTISIPGGKFATIHPKFAHRSVHFLVIAIGDYSSENSLLTPLQNSVTSFLRILIPGDQLKSFFIRTPDELCVIWHDYGALTSHIVLVGHGASDALLFGKNVRLEAKDLAPMITAQGDDKIFMSLCCHTGQESFGKPFSKLPSCQAFIAPTSTVHGCTASQFCQTFFSYLLLEGRSPYHAWKEASVSTPLDPLFAFWLRGTQHLKRKPRSLATAVTHAPKSRHRAPAE